MIGVEFPKYWILTMKNLTLGTLKKETEYIYSKIEEGCFWDSRWYYGWQYRTMICVRLGVVVMSKVGASAALPG